MCRTHFYETEVSYCDKTVREVFYNPKDWDTFEKVKQLLISFRRLIVKELQDPAAAEFQCPEAVFKLINSERLYGFKITCGEQMMFKWQTSFTTAGYPFVSIGGLTSIYHRVAGITICYSRGAHPEAADLEQTLETREELIAFAEAHDFIEYRESY
jgi:hypothetical protein